MAVSAKRRRKRPQKVQKALLKNLLKKMVKNPLLKLKQLKIQLFEEKLNLIKINSQQNNVLT
jgi:hypothetical protein